MAGVDGWEQRWDREKTEARLLWIESIRTVYAAGLGLLGISAPELMVRPTEGDAAETKDDEVEESLPTATKENP